MSRIVRAALTETKNVYEAMPQDLAGLSGLSGRLDDLRAANVDHHVCLLYTSPSPRD